MNNLAKQPVFVWGTCIGDCPKGTCTYLGSMMKQISGGRSDDPIKTKNNKTTIITYIMPNVLNINTPMSVTSIGVVILKSLEIYRLICYLHAGEHELNYYE